MWGWERPLSANGLEAYLSPRGEVPGIGSERGATKVSGISRYVSPHGSYRYVLRESGEAVAALQIVSRDGLRGKIANVYVVPNARRRGLATRLLRHAQSAFSVIEHADPEHRSTEAEAWIKGTP